MSPRILVVEDEPTINQAVADRLKAEGFTVRQAYDGPGAVALAQQWQPELVVLDVMLPGYDGLVVCRRVQAGRPARARRERVARAPHSRQTGKVDLGYLAGLSADAAPALTDLPEDLAACVLGRPKHDDWLAWNLGRTRADDVVAPTGPCSRTDPD